MRVQNREPEPAQATQPEPDPFDRLSLLTDRLDLFNQKLKRQDDMEDDALPLPCLDMRSHTDIFVDEFAVNANHPFLQNRNGTLTGAPVASVCAYPKTQEELDLHVRMLRQLSPSILVVLAQDSDVTGETSGYFKQPGVTIHGDLRMSSSLQENLPASQDCPLDMQVHEMCIENHAGHGADGAAAHEAHEAQADAADQAVRIPVLHLSNLVDGHYLSPRQMDTLIRHVCSRERTGSERNADGDEPVPLFHCKEGLGRAGQSAAHYMMHKWPDRVKSTESLIQSLRRQRSPAMLYSPGQINALAAWGKKLGIPELVEQQPMSLGKMLYRLGIENDDIEVLPDDRLPDVLRALKFSDDESEGPLELVLSRLREIEKEEWPVMLEHDFNGEIAQILWPHPQADRGIVLYEDRLIGATPEEYLLGSESNGVLPPSLRLTTYTPSRNLKAAAAYCDMPTRAMQGLLLENVMDDEKVSLSTAGGLGEFLQGHGERACTVDLGIDTVMEQAETIREELLNSAKFLLEFGDTCDPRAPLHRLVFRNGLEKTDERYHAIHFLPDGDTELLNFRSVEDVLSMVEENSWRDDGQVNTLSIMSDEKLPGLRCLRPAEDSGTDSDTDSDTNSDRTVT